MSAKQLRKLQALREAEKATEQALSHEESDADEQEEVPVAQKRAGFGALVSDSESEKSSGSNKQCEKQTVETQHSSEEAPASAHSPSRSEGAGVSASARRRRRKAAAESDRSFSSAKAPHGVDKDEADDELMDVVAEATTPPKQDEDIVRFEDGVLAMRRADFSVENERRRAMGHSMGARIGDGGGGGAAQPKQRMAVQLRGARQEGRTAHHRRLFLVTPTIEEPWPRPDNVVAMVDLSAELGTPMFDFEETPASRRKLEQLQDCLRAQNPQLLQQFIQQNPFCVDALLTLAEYHRMQAAHEQAFQLVRRATYAIECSFNPAFSPFAETGAGSSPLMPRVKVRLNWDLSWPGWTWLRTLWLHMQGLAGQGMHRTALEVCKLLLSATLPRDPTRALIFCDFLFLRARQYDSLVKFATHLIPQYDLRPGMPEDVLTRLDVVFPNFAYSVALARFMGASQRVEFSALNEVSVADVVPPCNDDVAAHQPDVDSLSAGAMAHASLMRALLLFPLTLRPLLDEIGVKLNSSPAGSPSRETWLDLLARQPFSNAAEFRHAHHASPQGRISGAYAKRCGSLWRPDHVQQWLHACAGRLASMHESSLFATELSDARQVWMVASTGLSGTLSEDYADLLPGENSTEGSELPPVLERAAQARLHPPQPHHQDEDDELRGPAGAFGFRRGAAAEGEQFIPTISLHSPLLVIFIQSLLPWGEIDRSGVRVEPLSWTILAQSTLGFAKGAVSAAVETLSSLLHLVVVVLRSAWALVSR